MNDPAVTRAVRTAPLLKYVGGSASLDFVNTVAWTDEGPTYERLVDYARLVEWAEGAGVIAGDEARRLQRAATKQPRRAAAALQDAISVRRLLQRVLEGLVTRGHPEPAALASFNDVLADALAHLVVAPAPAGGLQWYWREAGEELSSIVWRVVWAAAQLVNSDEARKIRKCAGTGCGWFYVDRSRNGMRRWCEMTVCGTREKNRRRAARDAG